MTLALYQRVILTKDIPEEHLRAGDVGVVVEHHDAGPDVPEGYEVEFFAPSGKTVAVVSVLATSVREVGDEDVLAARAAAGTASLDRG